MRKKVIILVLGAILTLSACGSNYEQYPVPEQEIPDEQPSETQQQHSHPSIQPIVRLEDAADLISTRGGRTESAAAVASGANDFAFRLSASLLQDVGYDNLVVSPYSVWMPLAALVNATTQAHRPALLEALGAGGISVEDVNQAASRMLFDLTNQQPRRDDWGESQLHIANAVFVNHNTPLRRDFAQTFADYFRGSAFNLDFTSQEAVDAVNLWASDNTDGLINEVIQEFAPNTIAAIANAIYFSGSWVDSFNPHATRLDTFYSPAGESEAYFMHREGLFSYFEDENVQAVTLGFFGGSAMTIILPYNGDAVGFLSDMTSEYLDIMGSESVLAEGKLLLPRFSVENTLDNLKDALIALGVPLFDEAAGPLTGGLVYNDIRVWLSNAVQVAMIEVDEEGATAAAVTVMEAAYDEAPPPPETTFEMICNTPFVFVLHSLTHDGGNQVLFIGVVNQV